MDIDFRLLESEEHFELLCRDVLEGLGARILSDPSRGPDGKKDILIEIEQSNILGHPKSEKFVVQCKHKAVSGKSVTETELGDVRSACQRWNAGGYLLITSTIPSSSVAANFEAINEEGNYSVESWDHKLLERKILNLKSSYLILERYGLYQSLDNVLMFIKTVISAEPQFPYQLSHNIESTNYKGAVYKINIDGDKKEKTIAFVGIINNPTKDQEESIRKENELDELYMIKPGDGSEYTISPKTFYNLISSIKDEWYQGSICKLAFCSPANPTLIRIIESCIKNNPYGAQTSSKNLVSKILSARGEGLDFMLVLEAVDTAVKYEWIEFAEDIFKWIDSAYITASKNSTDDGFQHTMSAVIQRLASALGRLDSAKMVFFDNIIELFKSSNDIQFKADLIEYFKNSKNPNARLILNRFKVEHGEESVYPTSNGVFYNSKQIRFVFNAIPWDVNCAVEAYYSALKQG